MTTDIERDDGTLPTDAVTVRELRQGDLASIVKIDKASTGRARHEYYEAKLKAAIADAKLRTSVVAELDGHMVGFLLSRVFYGEFGHAEPVAVIDSVGVDPKFRKQHVGQAMLRQLLMNLQGLRVERVETQVDWSQLDLLTFLMRQGFRPAPRLCLERTL